MPNPPITGWSLAPSAMIENDMMMRKLTCAVGVRRQVRSKWHEGLRVGIFEREWVGRSGRWVSE